MANVFATTVVPEDLLWLGWGRELTRGTLITPSMTMPFEKGKGVPDDKPTMLMDEGLRGVMGSDFNMIVGTQIADFPVSGDVYLDSIGFPLHNIFGDYQATGTTPTSATTVALASTAGATSFTVGAIGTIVVGSILQFGNALLSTAPTEVLIVSGVAGSVVTFANTPLRFNHSTNAAVAIVGAPFTHTFALLNGNGAAGQDVNAQPVTHTVSWWNNLAASTKARQYGYWCASGIDFKLNSESLFQHDTKGTALVGQIAAVAPTNTQPQALAVADWQFKVGIGGPASGGTLVNNITDATVSIARGLKPDFGLNGQQAPYVIARLGLGISGKLTFIAVDESPLIAMLNGTQQQLQITMTQGSGPTTETVTFNCQKAQYKVTQPETPDVLMWNVDFTALFNNTDIGSTGALGPGTVTIVNATPTY